MARRCGCASETCSCIVVGGDGIVVQGAGSESNPYVVTSMVSEIETGIDVQINNSPVVLDVHGLDFRGSGVTVSGGVDEAIITIPGASGGSGTVIPAGSVIMFASTSAPTGWVLCDGSTYLITTYPDLFAAIGTNFGGDGTTNFSVPDMRDRVPVGAGATKPINGTPGGSWTKSIAVANLPPHTHPINHDHPAVNSSSNGQHDHPVRLSDGTGSSGTVRRGTSSYTAGTGPVDGAGNHVHSVNVPAYTGTTGGTTGALSTPLDVTPPYQAMGFIIKT